MADDSFCFVHAADLHLDTPFAGIGRVSPEVATVLREASLRAFDTIVELALTRSAAFVVFAGDIYDGADRGLRAQLRFRDGLARLSAAGIWSFVVHGNHDPLETGWSAVREWPELVTVFGAEGVDVVRVLRGDRTLATVQGISYATRVTTENLANRLHRPAGSGFHVGLLHCAVDGASAGHAPYSPCSLEDLRATGLDYLALGHVHAHAVLATGPASPTVVYAGTPQARSVRAGELGAKGAVVVHVRGDVVSELEFVPCDAVRFDVVEVDVSALDDVAALADELAERGREQRDDAGGRSLVLRGRLFGRSTLHADLRRVGTLEQLLDKLRSDAGTSAPLVWWDVLEDETRPLLDREEIRHRGDFAADLLLVADEVLGDPTEATRLIAEGGSAPRALEARLRTLLDGDEERRALLDAAVDVALDVLAGDDT